MKDLDWKEHLRGPHAKAVTEAFHKEMASLASCKAAYKLDIGSPEYAEAVKTATLCRVLLDLKRSNEWKARCVLQGFRQDRVKADGPEFTYYAAVARLSAAVRGPGAGCDPASSRARDVDSDRRYRR